ncbi:type II toxin-antitoxin system VapC family toxin [Phyllobacterium sp. YR531]|uniref:type II toxin-antitoxin system tRNA(fMet)-specific endonuclease VapC n=1 Tax=Phyllobacterium sp. YR531 TaxID=1144343 RepID=UPI00026F87B7|nr:type II toxin-antitoxin system VapC family toxin [Phyllobacterium sp. YR531]EJM98434.1 putative nucleic acid-binding protein, contains PIN domain containing protein [Phyllobacterium sp. YR531]
MIRYILDTNAIISLIGKKSDNLIARILEKAEGDIAVSSIVVHELYFGAYRSQKVQNNLETLRLLLHDFSLLEFDREDARVSGEIRAMLAGIGTPIGPYDVLIAGQAKARNLVLVTNNVREFARVENLMVEDWTN